jgi:tetratricopeptide (TPR) repeat protein
VRTVAVPISASDARRLLRFEQIVLVVRGDVEAAGGAGYFRSEAAFRADGPDITLQRYELSGYTDAPEPGRLRRWLGLGITTAITGEDADLELRTFVTSTLEITHFKQVAKALLVLLSERALVAPHRLRQPGTLILPLAEDPELGDELSARTVKLQAEASRADAPRDVLERLEQQVFEGGLGGEELAAWITGQWFAGEIEGWTTPAETLAATERWSARYPDGGLLLLNLAAMQIRAGQLEAAGRTVGRARTAGVLECFADRLLGNLAWARQNPEQALVHYRRAAVVSRSALRWQIGDCYAALGDRRHALSAYRRSLRHDPFRVPAAEHARPCAGWGLLLPTFPPGWRGWLWRLMHRAPRAAAPMLRAWRRIRPEDPYLATWTARCALLRGDMRKASEWANYATRFGETNRLISYLDEIAVMALLDHPQTAEWVGHCIEHRHWLDERGVPGTDADAAAAVNALLQHASFIDEVSEAGTYGWR